MGRRVCRWRSLDRVTTSRSEPSVGASVGRRLTVVGANDERFDQGVSAMMRKSYARAVLFVFDDFEVWEWETGAFKVLARAQLLILLLKGCGISVDQ